MFVTLERNQCLVRSPRREKLDFQGISGGRCPPQVGPAKLGRQMEPMERVKKEQRPDPLVKIVTAPAKGIEFGAFLHQFRKRKFRAQAVERLVADSRIGGGD